MNTSSTLTPIIRALLVALGGYLAGSGWLSKDDADVLIQGVHEIAVALLVVVPVVWAVVGRRNEARHKIEVQEALGVIPDAKIGPVTAKAATDMAKEVFRLATQTKK